MSLVGLKMNSHIPFYRVINKIFHSQITTNYQDLFKLLAILLMLIDHLGLFCFPENLWLRAFGRLAMPIFTFFAGYNYYVSKQNNKYKFYIKSRRFSWLLFYSIILQGIIYSYFPAMQQMHILFNFIFGFLVVDFIVYNHFNLTKAFIILVILIPFTISLVDYGTIPIMYILCGYYYRKWSASDKKSYITIVNTITLLFSIVIFEFDFVQILVISLLFYILNREIINTNFDKKLNFKPLFLSRYLLEFYLMHFAILAIFFGW